MDLPMPMKPLKGDCVIKGCERKRKSRRLCDKHWQRTPEWSRSDSDSIEDQEIYHPTAFNEGEEYIVFIGDDSAGEGNTLIEGYGKTSRQWNWFKQAAFKIEVIDGVTTVSNGRLVNELTRPAYNSNIVTSQTVDMKALPGHPHHIELDSFINAITKRVNSNL